MELLNLDSFSLLASIAVFIAAATIVWKCGSRLSKLADQLAEETGVGRALIGILMLGGITSLPEIATTITASLAGNVAMAVSNILGGVSMQVTILALIDFRVRKQPISTATTDVTLFIQGGFVIIMLALTGSFILLPTLAVFHIGLSSIFIFSIFLLSLFVVKRFSKFQWLSYEVAGTAATNEAITSLHQQLAQTGESQTADSKEHSINSSVGGFVKRTWRRLFILSLLIFAGGVFVVEASESIAERTGIGNNFAGLVLVAITTSLPEISTTIAAVKLQRYNMAFSNIFGTNLFDLALLFLADLLFFRGPVLGAVGDFAVVAAFHGIVLTAIFLIGISLRARRLLLGIGYDSWLILIIYVCGISLLFTIQS